MYRESELIIPGKEKAAPEVAVKHKNKAYSYNLLPFDFPEGNKTILFTAKEGKDSHRFSVHALPEAARKLFETDGVAAGFVYADFTDNADAIPVDIDLSKHPGMARAFYTFALNRVMRQYADVLIPNFLHDSVCWFETEGAGGGKYRTFKKFSLRVQFEPKTGSPELLISFDGYAHVTSANLSELSRLKGFSNAMVRHIVFRGGCYRSDRLPNAARYHPEEQYILLNREIKTLLQIDIPVKPNKEKHLLFKQQISWFYKHYAQREDFKAAIPHHNKFRVVDATNMFAISTNEDLLKFGEGQIGRNIYQGFKDYGPVKLPPCDEVHFFYIYSCDQENVKDKFNNTLNGNAPRDNRISQITRVPMSYDKQLDIVFDTKDRPLETILNKIRLLDTKPGVSYFAFFINPWQKFESNVKNHTIYYSVKEALLLRNIMMQNMDATKISSGSLNYFIPNLAAAFTGKLGGIPWRLIRPHSRELIVGFGVFQSRKYNMRYTGSSVCFSNDGSFEAFDCFSARDTYALAAAVKKALYKYVDDHEQPDRLVIHFYRKLSHKALKPIEKMLHELELDIPVIVVSINKTYSNNITAFMHGDPYGLPEAGTVINYRPGQYLLYLNDRQPEQETYKGPMPMPLKISLWSNKDEACCNNDIVSTLMQQIYDFCFLYYRSVKHARLPVTIVYPELLAGIMPWFKHEVLQERNEGRMWFL